MLHFEAETDRFGNQIQRHTCCSYQLTATWFALVGTEWRSEADDTSAFCYEPQRTPSIPRVHENLLIHDMARQACGRLLWGKQESGKAVLSQGP